ncbi:hypothetical protein F7725_013306 [Dissostichus mawsoni]|uniref:C2 domain-containing protein n=1 Tax=Dissostichus mawsoni TaxID=36200 RepID=A0A7J5YPP7_DISMA|nr:hypothetical protein F7725_013306 [Dissostichus mawsoni]
MRKHQTVSRRLQRTPIKLQCFAIDSVSKKKESVGYIVLDLRSVQEVKQDPRWYPLLSSKYTQQRPALFLSMALESDTKPSDPSPDRFKAKKAPPRQVTAMLPDKLEATLIQDQGYHQVGPADHCGDMFVLSVTVAFATKLEQLIPSTLKLSAEGSGFFFYYSLLGNDITSEPFHNLLSPDFEPERASVYLCCGNHSLGSTDVSLSALAAVSVDLQNKAATVEGAFILQPPKRTKQALPALPPDLQPTVGVAVTLRGEDVTPQGIKKEVDLRPTPSLLPLFLLLHKGDLEAPLRSTTLLPLLLLVLLLFLRRPLIQRAKQRVFWRSFNAAKSRRDSWKRQIWRFKLELQQKVELHPSASLLPKCPSPLRPSLLLLSGPPQPGTPEPHTPIAVTLRYSYQFFGSAAPIMTNPPVELQRNMEASLPQSYCAFDFAALPQQLQDTFLRVPLVVEVWHRDSTSRDQLIGRASIQLSHLLRSERSRLRASSGEQSWRQTHQDRIPVSRGEGGRLSYVATLEDLGLDQPAVPKQPPSHPAAPNHTVPPLGPLAPRDTLEYRTALELELWKEEQEDLFDDQLRKKELSHMQALAEEWRRRDREREALVKKKEMEYNVLEEQLQKTLLQRELRAEHDLTQRELQESRRRLQQDCDHRAALERDKVYREQQNIRPEFRLQSEINLLTLEKVELERKLETTTNGGALKELARFKQREQENAMTRLKKQQAELEAMRLRYLAQSRRNVSQDRQELDDIKNQLNRLKQQEDKLGPASSQCGPAPAQSVNESADEHLSRLLEERDTLLRTGDHRRAQQTDPGRHDGQRGSLTANQRPALTPRWRCRITNGRPAAGRDVKLFVIFRDFKTLISVFV